jgi:CRP-like cAMP-binding protein
LPSEPKDVTYPKGDLLLKEGDPSGDLWIIRSGTVQVFRERRGREYILATLKDGEMLGTMTATTDLPRQASCRALSQVTVTIIPKDKVKELLKTVPKWANGFIKDLVSRVQYANELFIEREVAFEHMADSPVLFTIEVANEILRLAKTMALENNEKFFVSLSELMEKLIEKLGKGPAIHDLFKLFLATGILHEDKIGARGRYIPVVDINKLKYFTDIAALCIEAQEPGTDFVMPLAHGERKMLRTLAHLSSGNASPGETQILNLNDVEEGFLKRGEVEFRYATLERAEKLSLLKLDKTAQPSAIIIDNHFLDYGLRSLAVIREVTVENKDSGNSKKSLLY